MKVTTVDSDDEDDEDDEDASSTEEGAEHDRDEAAEANEAMLEAAMRAAKEVVEAGGTDESGKPLMPDGRTIDATVKDFMMRMNEGKVLGCGSMKKPFPPRGDQDVVTPKVDVAVGERALDFSVGCRIKVALPGVFRNEVTLKVAPPLLAVRAPG